jgi:hypothetical protein
MWTHHVFYHSKHWVTTTTTIRCGVTSIYICAYTVINNCRFLIYKSYIHPTLVASLAISRKLSNVMNSLTENGLNIKI